MVRVVIVGGGYVGMYTALGVQRRWRPQLRSGRLEIVVIDPQSHMTYQPFLPEAAAGSVEPRHVVVPLRRVLRHCRVVTGSVTDISHADRAVTVDPLGAAPYRLGYDVLVVCPGSISRVLPIPGLAEHGVGFKTIGEAVHLRNHVLSRLDLAASADDPDTRRRALTFVFIGGGYAGIEALAELENMAQYASRYTPIDPADLRWILVEAADRVMAEVSPQMAAYTVRQLRGRGIELRLGTRLESVVDGRVHLSDGAALDADTVVWTAGVRPHPVLARSDLPRDRRGRLRCRADLGVVGCDGVFAAGDAAAVPDLSGPPGALCGPSAQHAVRQARVLARTIDARLRGRPPTDYRHRYAGSVASLGLYHGVAEIYGIRLRGPLAWWMHRTYHVAKMPTFNRKMRIIADWTAALMFRREVVALGQLQHPRRAFERAATLDPPRT